ncbi:unknown protein [Oryza sativa Japonica Group]|jgi:hypothetical protein|uniref:Os01g0961000 protein n=3 Tax=Oryza sativa TaxID=4530 RepID=Q5JN35_ORYSJ|nr:hypothetical protein OsI_05302 [Oryza sativa Indica Group]KAB8085323.1 hypothetical protein EE612_008132 [Oryza sativa]KAF2954424.1 hypothetical protein DAI22_01g481100 [Oryza sativa Japonica Group]BAD87131.1 unknown protein [Oryza sativa Japonica Group]BAD87220.1 unknown protein [Oryza sativa Japonica Group]|eukprot:NP_001045470.2 Os01g0961000 [Oryza sativa Japonica Group]
MDCAVVQIVMQVVLRRSICRLQEVFRVAVELGAAILAAVRLSGMASHRPTTPTSSPAAASRTTTTTYYYSPVVASMIGMSRLDRH